MTEKKKAKEILTFLGMLSSVSGLLISKQMSTASQSGYASGRTLS